MSTRKPYPTDLTDQQWEILRPLVPPPRHGGRPREAEMREVINTLLYLLRTGCQWSMLPHDLVPKSTAYDYFAQWRNDGTWQQMLDALREQVREAEGREATPSAVAIDSQTVKTTEAGGVRGYDGGKKTSGRKRHVVVDTLGLLLAVMVTSAAADDGVAAPEVLRQLAPERLPRLSKILADRKYHNHNLRRWLARQRPDWQLEIKLRPDGARGFQPIPKRWVAERTLAWLGRWRRTSKDYERRTDSSESHLRLSSIHLMLRRLDPPPDRRSNPFHYELKRNDSKHKLSG